MSPTVKELAKLNKLHYLSASGKKGKARKKALKMGYESETLKRGVASWKHSDGHTVVTVKGTDPTNIKDLASDAKLAIGNLGGDTQLKSRRHEIKKIYTKNPDSDKYLTGHSLGGSISSSILAKSKSIRDNTKEAHLFNSGHTKAFNKELGDGMDSKVKKELRDKVTQHHVKGDLISQAIIHGSAVGTVQVHDSKGPAHSIDNFTG